MAAQEYARPNSPPRPSQLTDAVYREHADFLRRLAWKKYKVPDDVAENIAHDALLSLAKQQEPILNVRAWLCCAVYYACGQYWKGERLHDSLPEEIVALVDDHAGAFADKLAITMAVSQALTRLDTRCRKVIHLRFYDEKTSKEIGGELGTTSKYAEKVLYGCLDKLRGIYKKLTRIRR